MWDNSEGTIIRNNEIYHFNYAAIKTGGNSVSVLIEKNYIHSPGQKGTIQIGILFRDSSNCTIRYNIIDLHSSALAGRGMSTWNSGGFNKIYNNVMIMKGGTGSYGVHSSLSNDTYRNNIICDADRGYRFFDNDNDVDYSDHYGCSTLYEFQDWSRNPTDNIWGFHNYADDPQFIDTTFDNIDDFQLQSTSPCIDTGIAYDDYHNGTNTAYWGTTVPQGLAPDIGAYEFMAQGIGNTYYVRPAGGNYGSEDGSDYNNAWDGFSNINWSTVDDGDNTLYVAGTHTENMTIGASGEHGQKINIVSCELQYGASIDDRGIVSGQIYSSNKDYVYIQGLEVRNSPGGNKTGAAIYNYSGTHWDILDCYFHSNNHSDVYMDWAGGYSNVQECIFQSTAINYGLSIYGSPNSIVTGNYFDEDGNGVSGSYCFFLGSSCDYSTVDGNYFKWIDDASGNPMIVIRADVGQNVTGVIFRNNVCERYGSGTRPLISYHGDDFEIYNNIFVGGVYLDDSTNNIVKNNIFYNGNFLIKNSAGGAVDYNAFYDSILGLANNNPDPTVGSNNMYDQDPNFALLGNKPSPYYHLQLTSPAIDTGDPSITEAQAGTVDYDGNPRFVGQIDIGASEYISTGDTTPPHCSNLQPTGTLTSGTTSTTISLDTDETAICKYSVIANTNYDDMSNVFATTDSTDHLTDINGLVDGNSYTYYVRCQDEAGNANDDDFEISFSVASSTTYSISNFINLVTDWLKTESGLESDVNGDGVVNTRDLGIMMSNWQ